MDRHAASRVALSLLLAALLCSAQTEAGWRVGLARAKITPEEPMLMDGYASRTLPWEGVDSDIHAKAMALEDSAGNRALLITADILGFSDQLSERICRRLKQTTGLDRDSMLLNASHTHTGPMVIPYPGGIVPADARKPVAEYVRQLEAKVIRIAETALANMKPARLSWGVGLAQFVTNRREFTSSGVILGVNPRGSADRSAPVLQVRSPDGSLRAVVFGAAGHCVCLTGENRRISGDYAGFAQEYFEAAHPGVQAMFVTGCAGDASPFPRGTLETAKLHGRSLSDEVSRVLGTKLRPVRGPLKTLFRRVDLPLQKFNRARIEELGQGAPSYRSFFVGLALEMLDEGETLPERYNAPFALWQFGQDLTLLGYPGETLVDYVGFAEEALGPLDLWVAGYCNDVFGYLPSARVLAEGGYETRGLYTGVGLFDPAVEGVVIAAIKDMAQAVGRPVPSRTQ